MEKVQQALAIVATMTKPEQKELLSHLALLMQSSKKAAGKTDRDAELWIGELTDALDRVLRSGGSSGSSLALMKRLQGSTFESVREFMVRSRLQELTVSERVATYRILSDLLVKHSEYVARKSGAPLSPKLVFNCVGNLPGLFDSAFPGYVGSGMAKVIIRQQALHGK